MPSFILIHPTVDYTSPMLCTPVTPFLPTGDVPEEDRATDIGNMHKKFGKDHACGSGDILVDRHTHRQTYSSQYVSTALAGKVKIINQQQTTQLHIAETHRTMLLSSRSSSRFDRLPNEDGRSSILFFDNWQYRSECRLPNDSGRSLSRF